MACCNKFSQFFRIARHYCLFVFFPTFCTSVLGDSTQITVGILRKMNENMVAPFEVGTDEILFLSRFDFQGASLRIGCHWRCLVIVFVSNHSRLSTEILWSWCLVSFTAGSAFLPVLMRALDGVARCFDNRNDRDEIIQLTLNDFVHPFECGSASLTARKKKIPILYTVGSATILQEIPQPSEPED